MSLRLAKGCLAPRFVRRASCVSVVRQLHEGPDTLEGLLERHVVRGAPGSHQAVTTTRREALQLYRYILRATRLFVWADEQGVLWSDVLRASARKEFEEARFEKDPEIIARLLVGGRDAVDSTIEKFVEKRESMLNQLPTDSPPRN